MKLFKTALLFFWIITSTAFAQFTLSNGSLLTSGDDPQASGIDTVFVVPSFQNIAITYTHTDTTDFSWSKYGIENNSITTPSLIPSSIVTNQNSTTLLLDEPGGYEVEIGPMGSSIKKYIWVLDYEVHAPTIDSVIVYDGVKNNADSCKHIITEAFTRSDTIFVGDFANNRIVGLNRNQQIQWSADPAFSINSQEFRVHLFAPNIPYEDTRITATLHETLFETPNVDPFETDAENDTLYIPLAVKVDEIDGTIIERDNNNEMERSDISEIKGSAPLNVNFVTRGTNSKVEYWDWEILALAESDSQRVTFTRDSFRYEFRNDINSEQEADYSVRVEVSNDYCYARAKTDVKIVSSYLDASNILVLGFGVSEEAQQFKVVYKSLRPETFRGAIYNRWGRRVFTWTDPEQGWDGRFNGKYVSPGVYYYVISATGTDGEKWEIKRDLNVLREKDL